MQKLKAWIAAARPRTLPLSVSGIIMGAALGLSKDFNELTIRTDASFDGLVSLAHQWVWEKPLFWLAILTTIGFQVLSNFANDYGDGVKGTDAGRKGEQRMVASGIISAKQMKMAMIATAALTLFMASLLIFTAFGNEHFIWAFVFFNLAIAAIIAAVKYTVGESAYGYSGFGDLFVFVFFGIVAVLGTYFMFTMSLTWDLLLPAASIGLFSTAVLNLNNMRDIENDALMGKNTLVVKLGTLQAKRYHSALLLGGMGFALAYTTLHFTSEIQFFYALTFIPFLLNIRTVLKNKEPQLLDSELKKVALSTFAFAIAFGWLH